MGMRMCWIAALFAAGGLLGCSSEEPVPAAEEMFVGTESLEVFRIPAQPVPAINPKTGRATLVQGLYCPECDKWYPAPPLEAVGGNAGAIRCPVHESALSHSGPEPSAVAAENL